MAKSEGELASPWNLVDFWKTKWRNLIKMTIWTTILTILESILTFSQTFSSNRWRLGPQGLCVSSRQPSRFLRKMWEKLKDEFRAKICCLNDVETKFERFGIFWRRFLTIILSVPKKRKKKTAQKFQI